MSLKPLAYSKADFHCIRFILAGIFLCIFPISCASTIETQTNEAVTSETGSVIFFNGVILTMDDGFSQAQAIAVQDTRIVGVGTNDEVLALREPDTEVIDLNGLTLMPGFVDAHTHIFNDARAQGMSLDEAQAMALQNGITTLADLFVDRSFLGEIQKFEEAGLLHVRTGLYLVYNDPCGRVFGDWYKASPSTRNPGEMLRVNGVKIFTDGGSCGRPALSFEAQQGGGLGDLWMSQEELNQAVVEAQSAGYQVAIHAIGDRAVEQAHNAIAFALNGQPNTYRHRMEHISVIEPERIQRFGELDIIAVIPGIYPSCTPFGPPLPAEYGSWEWPWRELRESNPGMHIAWHSDFPFWSTNPFAHLYGFVTRKDVYSYYTCSPQEWLKDDTLSVEQALHVMTIDSAYALFREEEVGSLVPGKFADLIVLSQNPLTREAEKLKDIRVLVTIVNGQFEYCAANQSALCPGYSNRVPATLPDAHPSQPVSWLIAALVVALPIGGLLLGRSKRDLVIKIGGISGILSGLLLFMFYWVFEENPEFQEWITLPVLVFLSISAAGMLVLKGSSRFIIAVLLIAILGAIITAEGAILSVWLGQEDFWPLILVGAFILFAGLLLFGLANLKRQTFPRLNWLPLATVLLSILIPFLLRNFSLHGINWPLLMYTVIFGSGWVSMGILLLLTKEQ